MFINKGTDYLQNFGINRSEVKMLLEQKKHQQRKNRY